MRPLAVVGAGLTSGVGLGWASSCAAIRCGLNRFLETSFMDEGGEAIVGSPAAVAEDLRGLEKLVALAASAIRECLPLVAGTRTEEIPLLLCLAEPERPGRLAGLNDLFPQVEEALGVSFARKSVVFFGGRVGAARALQTAEKLIHDEGAPFCLVAGTDSLLVAPTLADLEARHRLLTSVNSNGFLPGEAGSAALLAAPTARRGPGLLCLGLGFGQEKATIESGEPLRADGLNLALRAAFIDCGLTTDHVDYRLADLNGEQYGFREDALALARFMRKTKRYFDIWHPVDSIGEVGAAIGPCLLGVALAAAQKGYAPGPGVLGHLGNDEGARAAFVLRWENGKAA